MSTESPAAPSPARGRQARTGNAPARAVARRPRQAWASTLEPWAEVLRWGALAVFLAVPLLGLLAPTSAGRIVWTVAVASLPLFIVLVGYHRWRQICPLAFFTRLPARLGLPAERKAPRWLQHNYYYVTFGIFLVALWLRLVATNGDGPAITTFFVLLTLGALIVGALFTGKTWCSYICPVLFVEKIYTEPRGLRETPNSQCNPCTACKPACPDINEENGYWKELGLAAKRFAYYAFPGVVFAFYFYYFLQAGTWDYYFSGGWTDQPGVAQFAFGLGTDAETAGFVAAPTLPRALAAALTLLLGAALSFVVFSQVERLLETVQRWRLPDEEVTARHWTFSLTAFAAFLTFYTFAGAPTLRQIPWMPHLFQIVVVLTAGFFLARRLQRTQQTFNEDTLARNILKRWEWPDTEMPRNLHDAYVTHSILTQVAGRGYSQLIEVYRGAVREALAGGLITRLEVNRLVSLRRQLGIKDADHERIMAELAEEERAALTDPLYALSVEKRLQLSTYSQALGRYLRGAAAGGASPAADDRLVARLRAEYAVTPEEHSAVIERLLDDGGAVAGNVGFVLGTNEQLAAALAVLERALSPARALLVALLRRWRVLAVERVLTAVHQEPDHPSARAIGAGLASDRPAEREAALDALCGLLSAAAGARIRAAVAGAVAAICQRETPEEHLRWCLTGGDPYVRATTLYVLAGTSAATDDLWELYAADEHELVRETAAALQARAAHGIAGSVSAASLMTVEKMIALRAIPMLHSLGGEDLARVARESLAVDYSPRAVLCAEGEEGNEVFFVLGGEVVFARQENGVERILGRERAGSVLGELAVLDPAPRAVTVRAGDQGAHVVRLDGRAFRDALGSDPAIAEGVIRSLAHRLRLTAHT